MKPAKVNQIVHEAYKYYYDSLGFEDKHTRDRSVVYARAAFMNIMLRTHTTLAVGKFFQLDHSTVCYHHKQHKVRKDWDDYRQYYGKALIAFAHVGTNPQDYIAKATGLQCAIEKLGRIQGQVVSVEFVTETLIGMLEQERKIILSFGERFAPSVAVRECYTETFKETF